MNARRARQPALRQGRTRFHDLAKPVLAFQRGQGEGSILCIFNLSATGQEVNLTDSYAVIGPSLGGKLDGKALILAPHAAVFLRIAT